MVQRETPPRVSGLALLAAASAFVFCLPLGQLLGALAAWRILRARGRLTGMRYAVFAVVAATVLNVGAWFFLSVVYPRLLNTSACVAQQLMLAREFRSFQRAQHQFRASARRYASIEELGWRPSSEADPYQYRLTFVGDDDYRLVATAYKPHLHGDSWELDASGVPRNTIFGCGNLDEPSVSDAPEPKVPRSAAQSNGPQRATE